MLQVLRVTYIYVHMYYLPSLLFEPVRDLIAEQYFRIFTEPSYLYTLFKDALACSGIFFWDSEKARMTVPSLFRDKTYLGRSSLGVG